LIAASRDEYQGVKTFLQKKRLDRRIIGRVGINGTADDVVTRFDQLHNTAKVLHARELVFCAGTLAYKQIIAQTEALHNGLKFRFHAYGSCSIVGSDASTAGGEILSSDIEFALAKSSSKRLKRLLDVAIAVVFLLSFPLQLFLVNRPLHFLRNCVQVILGEKTWVGYSKPSTSLPRLRNSVLAPNGKREAKPAASIENRQLLDYWYARNYEPLQDVKTIWRHYPDLGS
jgi:hypothetical protein